MGKVKENIQKKTPTKETSKENVRLNDSSLGGWYTLT